MAKKSCRYFSRKNLATEPSIARAFTVKNQSIIISSLLQETIWSLSIQGAVPILRMCSMPQGKSFMVSVTFPNPVCLTFNLTTVNISLKSMTKGPCRRIVTSFSPEGYYVLIQKAESILRICSMTQGKSQRSFAAGYSPLSILSLSESTLLSSERSRSAAQGNYPSLKESPFFEELPFSCKGITHHSRNHPPNGKLFLITTICSHSVVQICVDFVIRSTIGLQSKIEQLENE